MFLKSIEVDRFRNLSGGINFSSGTNVLYGNNGEGKTNWLESLNQLLYKLHRLDNSPNKLAVSSVVKAWKEALIASLEQRLSAPPVDLPPRERWAQLDPAEDEFHHVKFSAAFVPGVDALVYTTSSALRSDVSGPGYWVLAPARLATGGLVVVNRGFIPEGRQGAATQAGGEVTANVEMVGALRWTGSLRAVWGTWPASVLVAVQASCRDGLGDFMGGG